MTTSAKGQQRLRISNRGLGKPQALFVPDFTLDAQLKAGDCISFGITIVTNRLRISVRFCRVLLDFVWTTWEVPLLCAMFGVWLLFLLVKALRRVGSAIGCIERKASAYWTSAV